VPVQIATGLIMVSVYIRSTIGFLSPHRFYFAQLHVGAVYIDRWVGDANSTTGDSKSMPDVNTLTCYFLLLYFLMSTQDIAVDG
jgi:hypothetical protein